MLRARLANLFQHRRRGAAAAGLVLAAALAVTSLAACEQRLLTAEEAMDALSLQLEEASADYLTLQELYEQREALEAELQGLYDRWETLSAELEEARG